VPKSKADGGDAMRKLLLISPSWVEWPVPQIMSRAEPFITELPIKAALVAFATSALPTPSSFACFSDG
jgi:hypothetical protein